MIIIFTLHAKERMLKNAISADMITRAIKQGAKQKQTDGFLTSYTYFKVAYKKIGKDSYKIKTVFIN